MSLNLPRPLSSLNGPLVEPRPSPGFSPPQTTPAQPGLVESALARGTLNVGSSFAGLGEILGVPGAGDLEDALQEKAKQFAPRYESFRDIEDIPTAVGYAAERVVENLPMMASLFTGGGLAAAAARALGAAKTGAKIAGLAGGFGTDVALQSGETKQALEEAGIDPTIRNVIPTAALKATLDYASFTALARKFGLGEAAKDALIEAGKKSGFWKEAGKGALQISAIEGGTESLQSLIDIASVNIQQDENFLKLEPKDREQLLESLVAGAVTGGVTGAVGGGVGALRQPELPTNERVQPDGTPLPGLEPEQPAVAPAPSDIDLTAPGALTAATRSTLAPDAAAPGTTVEGPGDVSGQAAPSVETSLPLRGEAAPLSALSASTPEVQDTDQMMLALQEANLNRLRAELEARAPKQMSLNEEPWAPSPREQFAWDQTGGLEPESNPEENIEVQKSLQSLSLGRRNNYYFAGVDARDEGRVEGQYNATKHKPGTAVYIGRPLQTLPGFKQLAITESLRLLNKFNKFVTPNTRIILQETNENNTLGAYRPVDGGLGVISINLDWLDRNLQRVQESLSDDPIREGKRMRVKTQQAVWGALAHEYGHHVIQTYFRNARVNIKAAVYKEYQTWLKDLGTMTTRDFMQKYDAIGFKALTDEDLTVSAESGERFVDFLTRVGKERGVDLREYYANFEEFGAQMALRWLSKREALSPETKGFWAGMGRMIERLYREAKKLFELPSTVETFFEALVAQNLVNRTRLRLGLDPISTITGENIALPGDYLSESDLLQRAKRVATQRATLAVDTPPKEPPGDEQYMTKIARSVARMGAPAGVARSIDRNAEVTLGWPLTLKVMTPLQIAERYKIPYAQQYMDLVDRWNNHKMTEIERSQRMQLALQGLNETDLGALSQFVYDVTLESDKKKRRLTPTELQRIGGKYNLSPTAFGMWTELDKDMQDTLSRLQQDLMYDVARGFVQDGETFLAAWNAAPTADAKMQVVQGAVSEVSQQLRLFENLSELEKNFGKMRNRNYFPLTRFGQYTVRILATQDKTEWDGRKYKKGQTIELRTYETQREREKDLQLLLQESPQSVVFRTGKLDDAAFSVMGMPQTIINHVKNNMELSEEQRLQLDDIALKLAPGRGFVKHLIKRKGVKGFSKDLIRVYANYKMHAANHTARIRYAKDMANALNDFGEYIRGKNKDALKPGVEDTTGLTFIRDYYNRHMKYVFSPENDWAQLRAIGFLWYLGANVKSALVNLTQVPMIAYPVMAGKYKDFEVVSEITRAYKDIRWQFEKARGLDQPTIDMLKKMVQEGVIDESMVMELAGVGEGGVLSMFSPNSTFDRGLNRVSYYAGWLFRNAEKYNRLVTATAAFRLAKRNGETDDAAYNYAKETVRKSMFEYAKWNRPEFMRGKKSVFFLFWSYLQHLSYLATGGFFSSSRDERQTAMRVWAMLLVTAGIQGLPFAEHILDALDIFGTKTKEALGMANPKVEMRKEIREVLGEIMDNPDIAMHGLSRYYGLGPVHLAEMFKVPVPNVDVSGSISAGYLMPWLRNVGEPARSPDEKFGKLAAEVLGPVAAIPFQLWRAAESDDPDVWKRVEKVLPVALKSISKAYRWGERGQETDASGATLAAFDMQNPEQRLEAVAQALGFTPTKLSQRYETIGTEKEAIYYWNMRRAMVLDRYGHAILTRDKDAEKSARELVAKYNKTVANVPTLRPLLISSETLRRSIRMRMREVALKNRGINPQKMYRPLSGEIRSTFEPGLQDTEE